MSKNDTEKPLKHFCTVKEFATLLRVSKDTARRRALEYPETVILASCNTGKRRYRTIRIPFSVLLKLGISPSIVNITM